MQIYVIMIERIDCLAGCRFYNAGCVAAGHATQISLHPIHWAFREGVATTHLSRVTKDLAKDHARAKANGTVLNTTGMVHAKIADTDTFRPMFDDAEQAAYRIGGTEAVRVLRKATQPRKPRKPRPKRCPVP